MRPKLTVAALAAASILSLALTGSSHAAQTTNADQLVGNIASHQVQGWADNTVPAPVLEQRIRQGRRIYVTCSIVASLVVRAARAHGIPARQASVLTHGKFDGYNDGHAMLELKLGGHWVLYDPDMNRVAVDKHGHRIGLNQQVKAGHHRRWRMIANDPDNWNYAGTDAATRAATKKVHATPVADWYDHVMGVALVETTPGMFAYHTRHRSPRVEKMWPGHYRWVNARTWRALNV